MNNKIYLEFDVRLVDGHDIRGIQFLNNGETYMASTSDFRTFRITDTHRPNPRCYDISFSDLCSAFEFVEPDKIVGKEAEEFFRNVSAAAEFISYFATKRLSNKVYDQERRDHMKEDAEQWLDDNSIELDDSKREDFAEFAAKRFVDDGDFESNYSLWDNISSAFTLWKQENDM